MFSLRGEEPEMLLFVEDVGRHNAIDTIAGWLWMSFAASPATSGAAVPGLAFYTTGRLTSEMVIKSAQMGVPVVVSRSGITQMGHQIAQSVGVCAIGRATNKRFVCYAGAERLLLEPGLAQAGALLGLSS
jgi:FdhD protein